MFCKRRLDCSTYSGTHKNAATNRTNSAFIRPKSYCINKVTLNVTIILLLIISIIIIIIILKEQYIMHSASRQKDRHCGYICPKSSCIEIVVPLIIFGIVIDTKPIYHVLCSLSEVRVNKIGEQSEQSADWAKRSQLAAEHTTNQQIHHQTTTLSSQ